MSEPPYDYGVLLRPKCRVCSSPLRQEIDLRLMRKEMRDDGEPYTFEQIVDWAEEQGLKTSKAGLSRHKTDHLMPDVLGAIEAQRQVEAIAQATGQTLGMETAFLNMLVNKAIRALDGHDLDLTQKGAITGITRAIETLLKVKKAEVLFSQEKLEEAKGKMRSKGLSEDAIKEIEEQVLGLRR